MIAQSTGGRAHWARQITEMGLADELLDVSFRLGTALDLIREPNPTNLELAEDEPEAAEIIAAQGEAVMEALRRLAMRLDRDAMGRYQERRADAAEREALP